MSAPIPPPTRPVPGPPPGPGTGAQGTVAAVRAAVAELDQLDDLPVADHVGRYDGLHGRLAEALAAIDGVQGGVVRRARLDAELVRRGLARSREQAAELVHAGRVKVAGATATKPATAVEPATPVLVEADLSDPGYASRGGHKLAGALDALPVPVDGRRVLDAGASTGGFTDVLLRRGAREVVAVDVGYGQLAWSLRTDPRVRVHDRTNVRELTPELIGGPVDLTVADLSFIPLTLVLPALAACTTEDLLPMVKPQFEVGRELVGPKGVVRDPALRAEAVRKVADRAWELGLGTRGLTRSPLPGPAGNVEFFLWLRRDAPPLDPAEVARVVGP